METVFDECPESPSKNSYIGSYYQPPDRILPRPAPPIGSMNTLTISPGLARTTDDFSSKAVIDALKTLQEKIKRLEFERKTAEKNVHQFSQAASRFQHNATSSNELVSQLQLAEARCQGLEKQLDCMRRMVEKAEQDKNALADAQATIQKQAATDSSSVQAQREKLEKLEKECIKLTHTQSQAWMKMSLLEHKLVAEERERRLVQEKADQLQREMDLNLRPAPPPSEKLQHKKKSRRPRSLKPSTEPLSQSQPAARRLPFVAGTSTSPSHSVPANVQSVLHMLKLQQLQLCHPLRSLQQPRGGRTPKGQRRQAPPSDPPGPPASARPAAVTVPTRGAAVALGSLDDLLLALQDELGHMSFEHQELLHQLEETPGPPAPEGLQRELAVLLQRMEDKGAQITKLRQHQETVHLLTQKTHRPAAESDCKGAKAGPPPRPPPTREERPGRSRGGASQSSLQILKETKRVRNTLKTDDLSWET